MKCIIALLSLLAVASAKITQFKWNECGSPDPNRAVKILDLSVSPMPVKAPGDLTIHVKAQVAKDMPKFSIKLDVTRHTFVSNIHIPCTQGLGSCTMDGCTILQELIASDSNKASIGNQIKTMFSQHSFTYACPLTAQSLDVQSFVFHVPQLSAAADIFADGDYTIEAHILNADSGELYGCIHFEASLERSCSGWLCHGRRRRR